MITIALATLLATTPTKPARTEVTHAEYARCVEAKACTPRSTDELLWKDQCVDPKLGTNPVDCISAAQAAEYCRFVGSRLPTAKEWRSWVSGLDVAQMRASAKAFANLADRELRHRVVHGPLSPLAYIDKHVFAAPVGSYPASTVDGVADLVGNVSEWTSDGIALGTSYLSVPEPLDVVELAEATSDMRRPDIGVRCVAQPQ